MNSMTDACATFDTLAIPKKIGWRKQNQCPLIFSIVKVKDENAIKILFQDLIIHLTLNPICMEEHRQAKVN